MFRKNIPLGVTSFFLLGVSDFFIELGGETALLRIFSTSIPLAFTLFSLVGTNLIKGTSELEAESNSWTMGRHLIIVAVSLSLEESVEVSLSESEF